MAKRRRVRSASPREVAATSEPRKATADGTLFGIGLALLAGLLVYVSYFPSDSIAVESGDALWTALLALVIGTATLGSNLWNRPASSTDWVSRLTDFLAWSLAAWMMIAALLSSPPGNQRFAVNEAWFWITGAVVFTSARRLTVPRDARKAIILLMLGCSTVLATHGLHQHLVSLPQTQSRYERDPEAVLQDAGIFAPEGSAERMVFENRLYDGGATATFALANSLAGVLVVGALIAIGVLCLGWSELSGQEKLLLLSTVTLCIACIFAAGSRSGLAATVVGAALVAALAAGHRAFIALTSAGVAGVFVIITVGSLGNPEWFQRAPTSLAFRFQYWRSTVRLLIDRPLFGAGPGNFQSMYERFREDSAHEQIADPHNLLFETLGSGGLFAGVLLLGLAGLVGLIALPRVAAVHRQHHSGFEPEEKELAKDNATAASGADLRLPRGNGFAKWVWLGGGLSLVLVWLLGAATGTMPDIEANLFGTPIGIAAIVLIWRSSGSLSTRQFDQVIAITLLGLLIHLTVSGGWTVPGVAIHAWLLGGMLTRVRAIPTADGDIGVSAGTLALPAVAGVAVLLVLLLWLCVGSINPLQRTREALMAAGVARERGGPEDVRRELDRAIAADVWAADATIQKADFLHWSLVIRDSPSTREAWDRCIDDAKRRGGDNPFVYQTLGQQQLHLYQRHGDRRDLDAAAKTISDAVAWSRASEWLYAQLALIQQAQGDVKAATNSARRAKQLSLAGGSLTRILEKKMVLDVKPLGDAVVRQLRYGRASDLLAGLLGGEEDHENR